MKIAICSSMAFAKEMIKTKQKLEKLGHKIVIQEDVEEHASGRIKEEDKWRKLEIDPLKNYYKEIKNSDAIIVINMDKNNIPNYVGGNVLIEMAFAYILNKKIFLLNPIPKMSYSDEIEAMKPIILNGDLKKIS
jgi:predicted RNA-binding protein with PUA domain